MKRSEVISEIKSIIATCGPTQPTILTAEQVLNKIEALGFKRAEDKDYGYDGSQIEEVPYEPEEGWDAYFAEQEKKDTARDFQVVLRKDIYTQEMYLHRGGEIAQKFLDGKSFEELAKEYVVTRERIRQIVAKERRRYKKSLEGDDYDE